MEMHRFEWTTGPGIDSALIVSLIPAGKFIHVATASPRIIFIQSGSFDFHLSHRTTEVEVPVNPGDTLIIPSDSHYSYYPNDSGNECHLNAFRLRFFETSKRSIHDTDSIFPHCERLVDHFAHLPQNITPRLQYLIDQYRNEAEHAWPGCKEMLQCASTSILIELFRQVHAADSEANDPTGKNKHIVEGVRRFLVENLDKSFSLDEVAWNLDLSGEHVARVFKKETKQTVFEYLKRVRIEKAATLLMSSNRKIHEIATASGFSSHALFSREFRRTVGISPNKYRDQRRESISFSELRDRT